MAQHQRSKGVVKGPIEAGLKISIKCVHYLHSKPTFSGVNNFKVNYAGQYFAFNSQVNLGFIWESLVGKKQERRQESSFTVNLNGYQNMPLTNVHHSALCLLRDQTTLIYNTLGKQHFQIKVISMHFFYSPANFLFGLQSSTSTILKFCSTAFLSFFLLLF